MVRKLVGTAAALALCLTVSLAQGQPRGNAGSKSKSKSGAGAGAKPGGSRPGGAGTAGAKPAGPSRGGSKAPGGAWSDGRAQSGSAGRGLGAGRSAGAGEKGAAAEHAEGRSRPGQTTGKEGAAAGAAAANRRGPAASGAEGAAAGAAAANRRGPAASGAEGAAAGAAAANRRGPAASGAEGAAAGAAAANRNQPAASGAEGAAAGAAAANRNQADHADARYATVRNTFNHPNVYNAQWYAGHQGAWSANNWAAGAVWTPTNYAGAAAYLGYGNGAPVSYGYGNNVVYQEGNVIIDGQNAGTAEDFSRQAADLAFRGHDAETAATDDWLPLGVFALVRNEDQHAQTTVQLAVNQQGILRGNYTDTVTDHTQQIQGSVDKETQRAAWTIGDNKNYFMEAGLKNLTDGDAPALMHKYGRTEQWLLIRLEQPHPEGPVVDHDPAE